FISNKELESFVERFVSFFPPDAVKPGKIRIQGRNSSADLSYDPEQLNANIMKETFVNHYAQSEVLYLIDLSMKNPGKEGRIKISFNIIQN
ncbi:MAG TPA: hypothetical protein VGE40_02085, partial [Bacilli bacterium]